jgi:hypothetical protein
MFIGRTKSYFPFRIVITFLLLIVSFNLYTQIIPFDIKKEFLNTCKQILKDTIDKQTAVDYQFVVGRLHKPAIDKINHPYFHDNEWVNGSLVFKGKTYSVKGLKFDIENDRLIYLMYSNNYTTNCIALDENFISEFNILNLTFRYYKGLKNYLGLGQKEGYYQVVYDGKLKFLVRWEKSESLNDISEKIKYDVANKMFLLKNNRVVPVNNMFKLLNQLKNKRREMRTFVRDNKLKLNRSNYSSAYDVLNYYENPDKQ